MSEDLKPIVPQEEQSVAEEKIDYSNKGLKELVDTLQP